MYNVTRQSPGKMMRDPYIDTCGSNRSPPAFSMSVCVPIFFHGPAPLTHTRTFVLYVCGTAASVFVDKSKSNLTTNNSRVLRSSNIILYVHEVLVQQFFFFLSSHYVLLFIRQYWFVVVMLAPRGLILKSQKKVARRIGIAGSKAWWCMCPLLSRRPSYEEVQLPAQHAYDIIGYRMLCMYRYINRTRQASDTYSQNHFWSVQIHTIYTYSLIYSSIYRYYVSYPVIRSICIISSGPYPYCCTTSNSYNSLLLYNMYLVHTQVLLLFEPEWCTAAAITSRLPCARTACTAGCIL